MELRHYLRALRKFWWVLLVPALLGAGFGAVVVARQAPSYQASMSFFVRTVGDTSANGQFAGDQFAQRRVNSYVALLSTDRLAKAVIDTAHLDLTTEQVSKMISGSGDVNTVLLTATVTTGSEELSMQVADALAVQFVRMVNEVEKNTGTSGVSVDLVSGPSVEPVATRPIMKIGLFGFLGALVGLAAALVLDMRDVSVRSDDEIEELEGRPVLTHIPVDRTLRTSPLVATDQSRHALHEGFRRLRTNLQFLDVEHPARVVVITSSVPEEGKSTTTANLALVLAAAGRRVLVVEADLHRPTVAETFQVERAVGLTDVLIGRVAFDDVVQFWSDNLDVLPCGHLPPNPSELVGGEAMARLLDDLRGTYDTVLIDTPPLLPLTDAAVIAAHADGVVLVVRYGKTARQQLTRSIRSLRAVGARILGSVVTMVPNRGAESYASYEYGPNRPVQDKPVDRRETPAWVTSTPKSIPPTPRRIPSAPPADDGARRTRTQRKAPATVTAPPGAAPDEPRR